MNEYVIKHASGAGKLRAGFRSICPSLPTLRAAIARLHADGHLGNRKCLIVGSFSPLVYKGGTSRRKMDDSARKGLGPSDSDHAWLEVPAGCEDEAKAICEELC